jgi:DNA primase
MRGEVIFTFDGDEAGQKAALRAAELDQRFSAQTYVAVAPEGQDPCELRQAHGDVAVRDLLASRTPLVEFVVRAEAAKYDLDTPTGRVAALERVTPVLRGIRDDKLRHQYVEVATRLLGFDDPDWVRRQISGERPGRAAAVVGTRPSDVVVRTEREALVAAVQWPAYAGADFDILTTEAFTDPDHQAVHKTILAAGGVALGATQTPAAWSSALVDAAPDDRVRGLVMAMVTTPVPAAEGEETQRWVAGVVAAVRLLTITRLLANAKGQLQRLSPEAEDAAESERAFARVMELEVQRRTLLEQRGGSW